MIFSDHFETAPEAVYELPFYLVQPANCRAKQQR